ncbi:MAG: sterol desaturase family protein [Sphingomonadales bacterium]|nr:sterol desaturase family protein [Sphingomonadales bacterium]
MEYATTFLGIAQEKALHVFAFDFGRYAIAASLIAGLVWILKRTPWRTRQIQKRTATASDFRREFLASARTVLVYVVVSILVIWAIRHGYMREMEGSYGLAGNLGMIVAIIVAHDAYFYWSHRAMHHPRLFKHFHRFHHRTITPTAWAAYSCPSRSICDGALHAGLAVFCADPRNCGLHIPDHHDPAQLHGACGA